MTVTVKLFGLYKVFYDKIFVEFKENCLSYINAKHVEQLKLVKTKKVYWKKLVKSGTRATPV